MSYLNVSERTPVNVLRFLSSPRAIVVPDEGWPSSDLDRWEPLAWCMEWSRNDALVGAYLAPGGWMLFRVVADGRILVRGDVDAYLPSDPVGWGTLRGRLDPARCFLAGGPDAARYIVDKTAKAWSAALATTQAYRQNATLVLERVEKEQQDAADGEIRTLSRWMHPEDADKGWTKTPTVMIYGPPPSLPHGKAVKALQPVKSGERRGFLAIHKALNGKGWTVTHEPTGLKLAYPNTREEAREIAVGVLHLARLYPSIETMSGLNDVHPDARPLLRHLRRDAVFKVDAGELRESLLAVSRREATWAPLDRMAAEQAASYVEKSKIAALAIEKRARSPKNADAMEAYEQELSRFMTAAADAEAAGEFAAAHLVWAQEIQPLLGAMMHVADELGETAHAAEFRRLYQTSERKTQELWPKRKQRAAAIRSAYTSTPGPETPEPERVDPPRIDVGERQSGPTPIDPLERGPLAAWAREQQAAPSPAADMRALADSNRAAAAAAAAAGDTATAEVWTRKAREKDAKAATIAAALTPTQPVDDFKIDEWKAADETMHRARLASALAPRDNAAVWAAVLFDAAEAWLEWLGGAALRVVGEKHRIIRAQQDATVDLRDLAARWKRSTWPDAAETAPELGEIRRLAAVALAPTPKIDDDAPPEAPKKPARARQTTGRPAGGGKLAELVEVWKRAKVADDAAAAARKQAGDALEAARAAVIAAAGSKLPITVAGVVIDEEDVPEREVEAKPAHKTGGGRRHVLREVQS